MEVLLEEDAAAQAFWPPISSRPAARRDTCVILSATTATWRCTLPNGNYVVTLAWVLSESFRMMACLCLRSTKVSNVAPDPWVGPTTRFPTV